jgi:hypothetical protein
MTDACDEARCTKQSDVYISLAKNLKKEKRKVKINMYIKMESDQCATNIYTGEIQQLFQY